MRSVNKVIIIGNLTRDPEMRQTPNGQNVTTFGIATNREWVTKESERKNSAEFHECVAWSRLAEICANYLKKGNLIYIEGYLKTRSWDTPEGIRKFKTEVVIQDMIMLEKRKDGEGYDETASFSNDSGGGYYDDDPLTDDDEVTEEKTEEATVEPVAETAQEESTLAEAPAQEEPAPEEEKKEESLIDADLGL